MEEIEKPSELIDILHKTLLLWEKGKRDEIIELLKESGHGNSEAFYRVAQAISETLPKENKEKKLLISNSSSLVLLPVYASFIFPS